MGGRNMTLNQHCSQEQKAYIAEGCCQSCLYCQRWHLWHFLESKKLKHTLEKLKDKLKQKHLSPKKLKKLKQTRKRLLLRWQKKMLYRQLAKLKKRVHLEKLKHDHLKKLISLKQLKHRFKLKLKQFLTKVKYRHLPSLLKKKLNRQLAKLKRNFKKYTQGPCAKEGSFCTCPPNYTIEFGARPPRWMMKTINSRRCKRFMPDHIIFLCKTRGWLTKKVPAGSKGLECSSKVMGGDPIHAPKACYCLS